MAATPSGPFAARGFTAASSPSETVVPRASIARRPRITILRAAIRRPAPQRREDRLHLRREGARGLVGAAAAVEAKHVHARPLLRHQRA